LIGTSTSCSNNESTCSELVNGNKTEELNSTNV
jgi:hypothetical protein